MAGPAGLIEQAASLYRNVRDSWGARLAQQRLIRTHVGVTGSCGKSTTTWLVSELLKHHGSVATSGHPNYEHQVLRHVRKLRRPVDYMVQEMSGHRPGALDPILKAIRVDAVVVTSVGSDHQSAFRGTGSSVPQAIAAEKAKLPVAVGADGVVCLNADDPLVLGMAKGCKARVVTFGTSDKADYQASEVQCRWPSLLSFKLQHEGAVYPVHTNFVGTMMLTNVVGALALVHQLGMDLQLAIASLQSALPVENHMSLRVVGPTTFVLDTSKAPYWSTDLLADDLPRFVSADATFVLGDVSDIVRDAGKRYRHLMKKIAPHVQTLVITGEAARHGHGLDLANLVLAPTNDAVAAFLSSAEPSLVLLKANKLLKLSAVVDLIPQDHASKAGVSLDNSPP